jgi:hypothetical protein
MFPCIYTSFSIWSICVKHFMRPVFSYSGYMLCQSKLYILYFVSYVCRLQSLKSICKVTVRNFLCRFSPSSFILITCAYNINLVWIQHCIALVNCHYDFDFENWFYLRSCHIGYLYVLVYNYLPCIMKEIK